ncbi:hypothetical protein V8E55_002530 [Tylopilus felleus]
MYRISITSVWITVIVSASYCIICNVCIEERMDIIYLCTTCDKRMNNCVDYVYDVSKQFYNDLMIFRHSNF